MNVKKFQMMFVAIVAMLLANTSLVAARPAELPDITPAPRTPLAGTCAAVLTRNEALVSSIDIPSRWAEYNAIDQYARCNVLLAASTVPVTGRATSQMDARFAEFKMRQAERMGN